jgi:hypothetical protein
MQLQGRKFRFIDGRPEAEEKKAAFGLQLNHLPF